MRLDLTEIPLDSFLEECKAEIQPILEVRNQSLIVHSSFDRQGIEADRLKLNQVAMNLLTNASKYSPSNSNIEIHVDRDDEHLLFGVKDQGIGLKAEDIPKLFKPFPDIEVEGKFQRTGLGLSIAKASLSYITGKYTRSLVVRARVHCSGSGYP